MNRLLRVALIGAFLASSATASAAGAHQLVSEGNAYRSSPAAVQQPLAPVLQPLPAAAQTLAAANVTQRTINASQAAAHPALPPAAAERAPANQESPTSCPPTRSEVACRKP